MEGNKNRKRIPLKFIARIFYNIDSNPAGAAAAAYSAPILDLAICPSLVVPFLGSTVRTVHIRIPNNNNTNNSTTVLNILPYTFHSLSRHTHTHTETHSTFQWIYLNWLVKKIPTIDYKCDKKNCSLHTPNENRIGQFKNGKNEKENNCQSQMEQIEYVSCSFYSVYFRSFFLLFHSAFRYLYLYLILSAYFRCFLFVFTNNSPWNNTIFDKFLPENHAHGANGIKNDREKIGCVYRKWKQAIKSIYLALIFELLQLFA